MRERIAGKKITLRPAILADRRLIFVWLANSDLSKFMIRPPKYPECPIPTWKEFMADYKKYFFDNSRPQLGRCFIIESNTRQIGQVNYEKTLGKENHIELDIWLKKSVMGVRGYVTDAINTLCNYLQENYAYNKFVISPSKHNSAAIRSFEKAGFVIADENSNDLLSDYQGTVIMNKIVA